MRFFFEIILSSCIDFRCVCVCVIINKMPVSSSSSSFYFLFIWCCHVDCIWISRAHRQWHGMAWHSTLNTHTHTHTHQHTNRPTDRPTDTHTLTHSRVILKLNRITTTANNIRIWLDYCKEIHKYEQNGCVCECFFFSLFFLFFFF